MPIFPVPSTPRHRPHPPVADDNKTNEKGGGQIMYAKTFLTVLTASALVASMTSGPSACTVGVAASAQGSLIYGVALVRFLITFLAVVPIGVSFDYSLDLYRPVGLLIPLDGISGASIANLIGLALAIGILGNEFLLRPRRAQTT